MNKPELSSQNREFLSALADGELLPEEFSTLLQVYEQDPAASDSWNTYHVIGEALRSPGSAVQLADFAFLARLNHQLANEASLEIGLQPALMPVMPAASAVCVPTPDVQAGKNRGPASNDGYFRWKTVAGFACAAVVGVITWHMSGPTTSFNGPQLAQLNTLTEGIAPPQVIVDSPQGLMVRNAQLEEMLALHKQLGATSALPVPSGFLRNATFEMQQNMGR